MRHGKAKIFIKSTERSPLFVYFDVELRRSGQIIIITNKQHEVYNKVVLG
jgi:hypothetical protein